MNNLDKKYETINYDGKVYSTEDNKPFLNMGYDEDEFRNFLSQPLSLTVNADYSSLTLIEVIEKYAEEMTVINNKMKKYCHSSIYNLSLIEKEANITLYPKNITDKFWNTFVPYLAVERKLALSTIKSIIDRIVAVLTWASKHNCIINPSYKSYYFRVTYKNSISLSQDDVSRIYHFKIDNLKISQKKKETLTKVKDMFVLSCNLGQRFSDMKAINAYMFQRGIFKCVQQKTGIFAIVDMKKYCIDYKTTIDILKKYNYTAPYTGAQYNKN